MNTPDFTVNLTRSSLNSVISSDKTLWQPPLKWTSAHLSVLGIHPHRRRRRQQRLRRNIHPTTISDSVVNEEDGDSSDTDNERNHEGTGEQGERGDEYYDAVIPDLTPARLGQCIASFSGGGYYETRASKLTRLLLPRPPAPGAVGGRDWNKDRERRDDGVLGRRFSFRWMTPQLVVGPRTYKLHFLFHLFLNATLVLPYVDSSCVLRPRFRVHRRCDLTRPFEPFIAAVLISLAQSSVPLEKADAKKVHYPLSNNTIKSATDGVITTRLLFTHRDDSQDMHVYTAHISHSLLERFQFPNQPPTATTQPLIRLHHCRVPYVPHTTFRQRLLAAVFVTAIVEPSLEVDTGCRKRALSLYGENVSSKQRRSENAREPLTRLDVNFQQDLQPP